MAKTLCPVSKEQFLAEAKTLRVQIVDPETGTILGESMLKPTEFSSGGYGWTAQVRTPLVCGRVALPASGTLNVSAHGSKDRSAAAAQRAA